MTARGPVLLFLFGLLALSAPVLLPAHLLTQDGGAHYNTAMALAGLHSDAASFFRRFFTIRQNPPENQVSAYLMMGLARIGLGPQAERITWGLIFLAYAAVVAGNLALLRRQSLAFGLLFLPILGGQLVNLGFMNFLIGVVLFAQGCFLLHLGLERATRTWLATLLGVTVAVYVAHPFTAFAFAAVAGPLGCAFLLHRRLTASSERSLLFPLGCALVCLISAVLVAQDAWPQLIRLFRAAVGPSLHASASGAAPPEGLRERISVLAGLTFLSYSPVDFIFSGAFGLAALALAAVRVTQIRRAGALRLEDTWLAAIATLLAIALLVPRGFEYFFPERMIACALVPLLVWLSTVELSPRQARALLVFGLLLNVTLLAWRLEWDRRIGGGLAEYASVAQAIPQRTSLLTVSESVPDLGLNCHSFRRRSLPCRFRPDWHFEGEILGARPIAEIDNYQLIPDAGYFPLALRAPWSAYVPLIQPLQNWPPLGPDASSVVTGTRAVVRRAPPDVIITWDARLAAGGGPLLTPETLAPLVAGYVKVFTSRPLGAAAVYLRRGAAGGSGAP